MECLLTLYLMWKFATFYQCMQNTLSFSLSRTWFVIRVCFYTQHDSFVKIISNHEPQVILITYYYYQFYILMFYFCNLWLFCSEAGYIRIRGEDKIFSVFMEDPLSSDIMRRFASIYRYAISKHVYFTWLKLSIIIRNRIIHLIHSFAVYINITTNALFRGDRYWIMNNENIDIYL